MSARLTLVVCGAPLAARSEELAAELAALGWDVTTVLSPAAHGWRSATPEERSDRRPAAVLAFPLTFNTANKVAAGIMDTPAAGVLCDALGAGIPLSAVVMVNDRLWGHPVWNDTLHTLTEAGTRWVDAVDGPVPRPVAVPSGTGARLVESADLAMIAAAVPRPAPECG